MKPNDRIELLKNLLKYAEENWKCDNCGADNLSSSSTCTNCKVTSDKNSIEYVKGRVWGELEGLSHYLKYEINEDNWERIAADAMRMTHEIRKLLYFDNNAPFKHSK